MLKHVVTNSVLLGTIGFGLATANIPVTLGGVGGLIAYWTPRGTRPSRRGSQRRER